MKKMLKEQERLGINIAKYREGKSITQQELADYCGISKNHLSALERGVNSMSIDTFVKICQRLETTPNVLLDIRKDDRIIPELENALVHLNGIEQYKILECIKIMYKD